MTAGKRYRIAVVNTHPIQYFAPLYAYLNRDPELDITALYGSDVSLRGAIDPGFKQPVKWDIDLLAGYHAVFLGKRAHQRTPGGFFSMVCPQIWREIRSGRYDAVWLHGYTPAMMVIAFLAAKSRGLPVFIRGDTHLGLHRSHWKQRLRDGILRHAYRHVAGCLAIGTRSREYYRSLGVPDSKIFDVPYSIDNDRFVAAARLDNDARRALRAHYGLPTDRPVVLYASKFMRRKHPDDVVTAMASLQREGTDACLFLVGTGEMESELRAQVARLKLDDCVVFGGFVNQSELPKVYAASDVFVLPSEDEPWGLIVNEVMCAGLPVVVADEVGCVPDLVHDNVNGALTKAGDANSLANALRRVLHDDAKRHEMGKQSVATILGWGYAQCLQGVKAALATQTARA